ncbi:MAG: c-type cytochrome [Planctomyces sp.]|nr:c-type cytochrome [Planctomyces sp.]
MLLRTLTALAWWTLGVPWALSAEPPTSQLEPPLSPDAARAAFVLPADLEIQLVAAEPDVVDPVAISWDAAGRMYVCEMGDYPAEPTGGRIRLLEDTNGDGRADRSVLFADGLPYPTGALPYHGGVLVSAAPDILFLQDRDGDGRADVRQVLFTGFGEGNQQLRVNGLMLGLDGWVYGANGRSDGEVRCVSILGRPGEEVPATATVEPVSIRGRDFRLNLRTGVVEATAGFSQFGHAFDDDGERFLSWNTVHIRHVVLDPLGFVPGLRLTPQAACAEIADHGSTGRIYPISRTTERFNAEEPGFFNASCGLTIYRGDWLPAECRGNAFACEPLSNIVHRDLLRREGATFVASRAPGEQASEFLATTDGWFRPVNLATGPDGALYVVDFYRRLVEHPQFVADEQARRTTDFRKGDDRGRIWRIVPRGAAPRPWPNLTALSGPELVDALSSGNGWIRDTAQRLLSERRDSPEWPACVARLRDVVFHAGASDLARIHALWTLGGPDALTEGAALFDDSSLRIRRHAALAASRVPGADAASQRWLSQFASSDDESLRLLALWAICRAGVATDANDAGAHRDIAEDALRRLWRADSNGSPWARRLLLAIGGQRGGAGRSALAALLPVVVEELKETPAAGLSLEDFEFLESSARQTRLSDELAPDKFLTELKEADAGAVGLALYSGILQADRSSDSRGEGLNPQSASEWQRVAGTLAGTADASPAERVMAIRVIGHEEWDAARATLEALLQPEHPVEVQQAAIRALSGFAEPEAAGRLLDAWPRATPALRRTLLDGLLTRREFAGAVVDALEDGRIEPAEVDALNADRLVRLCDAGQAARVRELLRREGNSNRTEVVAAFQPALALSGDARRGSRVFVENCQSCHSIQGQGRRLGPDLASVANRPPADVLVDILDPNRNVPADGMSYVAVLSDGRILSGLLAGESPRQLMLRRADGEDVLDRADIEELRNTGRSLMPEGFEKLTEQGLADLLAFLRTGQPPTADAGGP